jgi:hypothetical protein
MPAKRVVRKHLRHETVHVVALNADIDRLIVPLVRALNDIPGVKTLASCQGQPGPLRTGQRPRGGGEPGAMMAGGRYGYVDFVYGKSWWELCGLCFGLLAKHLLELDDDVMLAVWRTDKDHYYGSFKVRQEAIQRAALQVKVAKLEWWPPQIEVWRTKV